MLKKLLYNPLTNKKLKPIIKFNGGRGAILCHKCRKIIRQNLKRDDLKHKVENLFCTECATELVMKLFKSKDDEHTGKLPEKS